MGWVKQKKNEHACAKPRLNGPIEPDPGDVWECDYCGSWWQVHEDQRDGLYWTQMAPPAWNTVAC